MSVWRSLISAWLDRWLLADESMSAASRCASIIGDEDDRLLVARVLITFFLSLFSLLNKVPGSHL